MKTHALNWRCDTWFLKRKAAWTLKLDTGKTLRAVLLILAAILPAALVSIATLWAISAGAAQFVSALYWAGGFIFLALMVENEDGYRTYLATSGLGLMTLAWLSSRVAPEFGVLAGFLVAAWLAAPVVRRLAVRDAGLVNSR
jgi:hypothetical protein